MEIDPANLPKDTDALQALVRQLLGTVKNQSLKILSSKRASPG